MEDGQDVVAVLPFRRGDVDLDGVVEVEEFRRALSLPEQGIEGTDQRGSGRFGQIVDRLEVLGQGVAGTAEALHFDLDDPLPPEVAGDDPAPLRRVEFRPREVVDEVPFGGDAATAERDEQPTVVVLGERRGGTVRMDALRQVVDAPEVAPPGHRAPAVVPQELQRPLVLVQPPRERLGLLTSFRRLGREVGALQRSFGPEPPQHPALRRRRGRVASPPLPARPALGREAAHAPAAQRKMGDGKDRGFVSPVLVRQPLPVHPAVHAGAVVRPEAAPEGQIVGAVHDVHAVELQRSRPLEVVDEGAPVERSRPPRPRETLTMQPQPDRGLPRELRRPSAGPGHARSRPRAGSASRSALSGT